MARWDEWDFLNANVLARAMAAQPRPPTPQIERVALALCRRPREQMEEERATAAIFLIINQAGHLGSNTNTADF